MSRCPQAIVGWVRLVSFAILRIYSSMLSKQGWENDVVTSIGCSWFSSNHVWNSLSWFSAWTTEMRGRRGGYLNRGMNDFLTPTLAMSALYVSPKPHEDKHTNVEWNLAYELLWFRLLLKCVLYTNVNVFVFGLLQYRFRHNFCGIRYE